MKRILILGDNLTIGLKLTVFLSCRSLKKLGSDILVTMMTGCADNVELNNPWRQSVHLFPRA